MFVIRYVIGTQSSSFQTKITLKSPTTSIYIRRGGRSPAGVGAIKSLKTSKPLKQGVRTVDIFKPLTVNWLLGRLINTLADKVNGA